MATMQEKTYRPVLTESQLIAISQALIAPSRESLHSQQAKLTIDSMLIRINKRRAEYGTAPATGPAANPIPQEPVERSNVDWIQYIKGQVIDPSEEALQAEQVARSVPVAPATGPLLDPTDLE